MSHPISCIQPYRATITTATNEAPEPHACHITGFRGLLHKSFNGVG